jgi:hypothetical protein
MLGPFLVLPVAAVGNVAQDLAISWPAGTATDQPNDGTV